MITYGRYSASRAIFLFRFAHNTDFHHHRVNDSYKLLFNNKQLQLPITIVTATSTETSTAKKLSSSWAFVISENFLCELTTTTVKWKCSRSKSKLFSRVRQSCYPNKHFQWFSTDQNRRRRWSARCDRQRRWVNDNLNFRDSFHHNNRK